MVSIGQISFGISMTKGVGDVAKKEIGVRISGLPETEEGWAELGRRFSEAHHKAIEYYLNHCDDLSYEQKLLVLQMIDGKEILFS